MSSSSRSSIRHPRRPPSPVSMYAVPEFGTPKPPKPLVKIEHKPKKSKSRLFFSSPDPSSQTSFPTLSPTPSAGPSLQTTRTSRSSFSLSPLLRRLGIGRKKPVSAVPPPVPDIVLPVPQHQRRGTDENQPTYTLEGKINSYRTTAAPSASSTFPHGATLLQPKTLNPSKTPRRPKTAPSGYVPRNFAPEPWSTQAPPSDNFLHPSRYHTNHSQSSFNDRSIATRSRTSSESSCYSQESALSDRHLRTYHSSSILRPDRIQSPCGPSSRPQPPSLAPGRLRTLSEFSSTTHLPESKSSLSPIEFSLKSPKSAPITKQRGLDKVDPPPKLRRPRTAPHAFVSRDPALFIAPRPDTPFLHYLESSRGYVGVSGWKERKQGWSGEWNRDNLQEVIGVLRNLR
ncbi:uncharacterized protein BT62DRAFT_265403 [Guyanagaster necrorhizus]|uniref:Uncharacterized protein n=1 Tax=Guyanagaster necrorhizus TaxID=856835 RepID=A0A9P7W3K0_9AGAR|nr:uncharacterized protein BT62DRAFT_265403 [Guyanagaster necrorhizus MCA 3950]KAG7451780.1 hypothetical protein BT62DRAFT_265403 [Guyanagaster necrorhizus MCA 3950]